MAPGAAPPYRGPWARRPATHELEGIMREQLAAVLEDDDAVIAEMVRDDATTITEIDDHPLVGWRLLDVFWRGRAHPQRWYIALRPNHPQAVVLSGHPESWSSVIDEVVVHDASAACTLAVMHADLTRSMGARFVRVESVDEIPFFPRPPERAVRAIEAIRESFADRITSPKVTGDGPWQVELWTVTGEALVRHDVTVDRHGSVDDDQHVEVERLPVPMDL